MRDRLIEILNETFAEQYEKRGLLTAPHTADHLLAKGVIVPPCKVGDTVYYIHEGVKRVYEGEVTSFVYVSESKSFGIHYDGGYGVFGRYVFLTKEEAEKALERSAK